jgi:ABC-type multidrug transport system ATPase subunit
LQGWHVWIIVLTGQYKTFTAGSDVMSETPDPADNLAASGRGLKLTGLRGLVYGPVDFDIEKHKLTTVSADPGAGRTSFLLTLAGRMKPDTPANLTVLGFELPRERTKVQRLVGIAGFTGIDDLDGPLSIRALLKERENLLTPWYHSPKRFTDDKYEKLMLPVFGDRPLPSPKTPVRDLGELDEMLVRAAIALVGRPKMLIVDDVDRIVNLDSRHFYFQRLAAASKAGLSVIASIAASIYPSASLSNVLELPSENSKA